MVSDGQCQGCNILQKTGRRNCDNPELQESSLESFSWLLYWPESKKTALAKVLDAEKYWKIFRKKKLSRLQYKLSDKSLKLKIVLHTFCLWPRKKEEKLFSENENKPHFYRVCFWNHFSRQRLQCTRNYSSQKFRWLLKKA